LVSERGCERLELLDVVCKMGGQVEPAESIGDQAGDLFVCGPDARVAIPDALRPPLADGPGKRIVDLRLELRGDADVPDRGSHVRHPRFASLAAAPFPVSSRAALTIASASISASASCSS